jgi:hypothetical protein
LNYKENKEYSALTIQRETIPKDQQKHSKGFLHQSEKLTRVVNPPRPMNQNQTI